MNENQSKQENLLDTTDCLEAIGVFKGWKNFLFIVVLCCMLILQAIFWALDLELIGKANQADKNAKLDKAPMLAVVYGQSPNDVDRTPIEVKMPEEVNKIKEAAGKVAGPTQATQPAANQPRLTDTEPQEQKSAQEWEKEKEKAKLIPDIKSSYINWLIRLLNFVLILAAVLYCLTIFFSLLISVLGRLGGVNHITRAFFMSLIFLIILLPWQNLFTSAIKGVIYTPQELCSWMNWYRCEESGLSVAVIYYLRFSGYWLLALVILILSIARTSNWTKATLKRLEVI